MNLYYCYYRSNLHSHLFLDLEIYVHGSIFHTDAVKHRWEADLMKVYHLLLSGKHKSNTKELRVVNTSIFIYCIFLYIYTRTRRTSRSDPS